MGAAAGAVELLACALQCAVRARSKSDSAALAAACSRDGALAAPPMLRAAAAWLGLGGAPPLPPPLAPPPLPPREWLCGGAAGAVEKVACLGRTGLGLGSSPGGNGWIDREVAGRPMLAEWAAGSNVLPMLLDEWGRGGWGCCRGTGGGGSGAARGGGGSGGGGRGTGGGGSSSSVRSMNAGVDIAASLAPVLAVNASATPRRDSGVSGGGVCGTHQGYFTY